MSDFLETDGTAAAGPQEIKTRLFVNPDSAFCKSWETVRLAASANNTAAVVVLWIASKLALRPRSTSAHHTCCI